MRQRYPLEALLRPPIELWSAAVAGAAAAIAGLAPWAIMVSPGLAYGVAGLLAALAVHRGRQAHRVLRYQHNLRRLPRYTIRADAVPVSQRKLFLGRGFRWDQRHTQRLRDTLRPQFARYVEPGALYRWARRSEIAWESHPVLRHPAAWLSSGRWWNPLRPLPAVGGKPQLHGVEPAEQAVWMDLRERVGSA